MSDLTHKEITERKLKLAEDVQKLVDAFQHELRSDKIQVKKIVIVQDAYYDNLRTYCEATVKLI